MSNSSISIESISAQKLANTQQQAQVSVIKSAQDQQSAVASQLLEGATGNVLPPGVGAKVNISA